jgi:hypothetical protein
VESRQRRIRVKALTSGKHMYRATRENSLNESTNETTANTHQEDLFQSISRRFMIWGAPTSKASSCACGGGVILVVHCRMSQGHEAISDHRAGRDDKSLRRLRWLGYGGERRAWPRACRGTSRSHLLEQRAAETIEGGRRELAKPLCKLLGEA